MYKKEGFTLIELLVVIAIIALLMAILMPALARARNQARAIACQSSLHQWALFWSMYTSDYNGDFFDEQGGESLTSVGRWPQVLEPLYKNIKMRLCPSAKKTEAEGGINPHRAWSTSDNEGGVTVKRRGSYGINEWLSKRSLPLTSYDEAYKNNYFGNVSAKPANNIPVFLDCVWYDLWVFHTNVPPANDGDLDGSSGDSGSEMKRVCLNRHNGFVNCAFLDWSVRKVGLKELWTLKWHRRFNTKGHWTLAGNGGVPPSDWPQWLKKFKNY